MKNKRTVIEIILAAVWVWAALYGVICFNRYVLMSLPLAARMAAMVLSLLAVAAGPVLIAALAGDKPADFGFAKNAVGMQLLWGVILGAAMSLVLTLPFHLFGLGDFVDSGKRYTEAWQFAYEFFYCIAAVGLSEEVIFRGFFYNRFARFARGMCGTHGTRGTQSVVLPVALSSVLFGFYHIFGVNPIQIVTTAALGVLFCILRLKIKNCSTLSLIIAHGIYDAMICVWSAIFM